MERYLRHDDCLMEFLRRELDDPLAVRCQRCARCIGHALVAIDLDPELVDRARTFLRGQSIVVAPRKQWPDLKKIECRAEVGRALSHYGNGGWGQAVAREKAAGAYSDELARALADLVAQQAIDPPAEWVTCVPSLRHPDLVPALAARVAARLRLPFVPLVTKTRETRPQKEQNNSAQQYANVQGAFAVTLPVPAGPVVLIDDIVDSRWTLTEVAALLRQNGSGPVHPMLLAEATSD